MCAENYIKRFDHCLNAKGINTQIFELFPDIYSSGFPIDLAYGKFYVAADLKGSVQNITRNKHIIGISVLMFLLFIFLTTLTLPVAAMSPDHSVDCDNCQYPTVVRMPLCTGIYLGNRLVVTAGHCIDNVSPGNSRARFGEISSSEAYEVVIESCEAHPDGESDTINGAATWLGPDIGYCILEEALEDLGSPQGATPIIPSMFPEGCEADWLSHKVYQTANHATVTAIGMGCSIHQQYGGQNCEDGTKRFTGQQLVRQRSYNGSSTKLELQRDLWDSEDDSGIRSGDSGGPVLVKMPDQTWRLIGVIHGTGLGNAYAEAVPPYLHWIEQASGIDVTPSHSYSNGTWSSPIEYALLPKYQYQAFWGNWNSTCAAAPKGNSYSYTQEPWTSTIQCPGWPSVPDELIVDSVKYDNNIDLRKSTFMVGTTVGTSPISSRTARLSYSPINTSATRVHDASASFAAAPNNLTTPLPFLPIETIPEYRDSLLIFGIRNE